MLCKLTKRIAAYLFKDFTKKKVKLSLTRPELGKAQSQLVFVLTKIHGVRVCCLVGVLLTWTKQNNVSNQMCRPRVCGIVANDTLKFTSFVKGKFGPSGVPAPALFFSP